MKIRDTIIRAIITMSHSKWLQPAVLTLVVGVVLFVGTGCRKHH
jgi:uncharacterized membrane protein YgdD (TMEM256/DUF423 family)